MKTNSFKRITVKDICDTCKERRQNFYYHFRDKYDLVTWIYYQDAAQIIENYTDQTWEYVLEKIFENMAKRKSFYKNAFEETGQNALIDYLVEHDILIYTDKLGAEPDAALKFAIEYHSYACAYITQKWLSTDSKESPKELAHLMYTTMPEILKNATNNT